MLYVNRENTKAHFNKQLRPTKFPIEVESFYNKLDENEQIILFCKLEKDLFYCYKVAKIKDLPKSELEKIRNEQKYINNQKILYMKG